MATGGGIKLEFGLENAKEIAAALALLEDLPSYLTPAMSQWSGTVLHKRLSGTGNYPPPRGNYQRTGRLGSSWKATPLSPGQYEFSNPTEYAGYVVGDDQAWMHQGRWWKVSERIDETIIELALLLDKALSQWPRR